MTSLAQILQSLVRKNKLLVIDVMHNALAGTSFIPENIRSVYPLQIVSNSSFPQTPLHAIGEEVPLTTEHSRDVAQYVVYFKNDYRPYVLTVPSNDLVKNK